MINFLKIILIFFALSSSAYAQSLEAIEDRIKEHNKKMIDALPAKEEKVREMVQSEENNWQSKTYNVDGKSIKGPEEHPWLKNGSPRGVNPNFASDYQADSKNIWDTPNFLTETWSCFEPQLVGYEYCDKPPKTADLPLYAACWAHCCLDELPFNTPITAYRDPQGDYFSYRGGDNQEYIEIIQFWWPENQASINNYGRMRMNPMYITGEQNYKFLRDTLIQDKQKPEKTNSDNITKEIDEGLPTERYKVKDEADPDWRKDPFKGQYQSRDGSAISIDEFSAHVYRTHISSQLGDSRPNSREGFDGKKESIYDALEPDTKTKLQLNIWTEYDYFDFLSTVDSASFSIEGDEKGRAKKAMEALLGERKNWIDRAGKKDPSYKSKGEIAYRVAKWDQFKPLKEIAGIQDDDSEILKEVVYFNGLTLYPLSFTYEGNFIPELSLRSISARKAFEIAGNKKLSENFPGKEKSRMNTYTISDDKKDQEIDKMQRHYPLWPEPNGRTGECYRSQKIPNHLQQTEDQDWTAKQFPSDIMGYVKQDNHDSSHVYWNKRLACTCKKDSIPGGFGSQELGWIPDGLGPGRGTGDRIYGKFEKTLCTYQEGSMPSAFAGKQMPTCVQNPNTKKYKGLNDNVSSRAHQ